MKNTIIFMLIILSLIILTGCTNTIPPDSVDIRFYCEVEGDCSHTCGVGCANIEWTKTYEDPCVNIRAYDCTCVNNRCYSDGLPSPR